MTDFETIAQSIVALHGDKALEPVGPIDAAALILTQSDPVYHGVKWAARRLGFIENDAECLARAWARQCASDPGRNFDPTRWPQSPADFGMAARPRSDGFASCPASLGVYAVLPDASWVARMSRAGVPTVQLRYKSDDEAAIRREVAAAVDAVRGTTTRLFINDHWRHALDAGAYGVHLGQEDMDVADLSAIRNAGLRLGLSSHGYAEMVRAEAVAPSYIAMGAIYPTTLKRMATAPQGAGRLAAYTRLLRAVPTVAIGGISLRELPTIKASGVGSVAVVRAITAEPDPESAARSLMAAWDAA